MKGFIEKHIVQTVGIIDLILIFGSEYVFKFKEWYEKWLYIGLPILVTSYIFLKMYEKRKDKN